MNEQDFSNADMSDEENTAFEDDVLDLGSEPDEGFDPFDEMGFDDDSGEMESDAETKEAVKLAKAEKLVPKPNEKKVPPKKEGISVDPIAQAMEAAETKEAQGAQKSLFSKLPIFSYAAANEEIEDTSKTFEDLRIEKSKDFPELEDGKRVSWTIEYGKITKTVPEPKSTTISKMKSDIETSKEFLEALKKSKDKEPVCKLKPRVTAQTKGKISTYKGVFTSMEDACASGKVITLFPARDGKVYEMRQNEMGRFITPSAGSDMLNDVKAGFYPALPPIPYEYLLDIISFFRMMARKGNYEALVNIYWDKEEKTFIADVPTQTVTSVSVNSAINSSYDSDRYIHYLDIHSHNRMKAFFSETDNKDEKATRVYAVMGNVLNYFPEIKVRISNGGSFLEIDPVVIFEDFYHITDLALSWYENVQFKDLSESKRNGNIFTKLMLDMDDTENSAYKLSNFYSLRGDEE